MSCSAGLVGVYHTLTHFCSFSPVKEGGRKVEVASLSFWLCCSFSRLTSFVKIKQNLFTFLLISGLVRHKAKMTSLQIRGFDKEVYRVLCTSEKRVAPRGWRKQGCEAPGSAFESQTFHLV